MDSFYPVIIGTACCATTAPVFVNAASMLANNWFSDKERAFATAIGTIAMPIGTLSTLTLTGIKFSDVKLDDEGTVQNIEETQDLFYSLLLNQNTYVTLMAISFFFIVKERPDKPPSAISLNKPESTNLWESA